MEKRLKEIEETLTKIGNGSKMEIHSIWPGMALALITLRTEKAEIHHAPSRQTLEVHYCRSGRVGWKLTDGSTVYMGPGDYSVHTMDACADSVMTLPNGYYEGLILCMDLTYLENEPPELLTGTGMDGSFFRRRFGGGETFSFAGTPETEGIFASFFDEPEPVRLAYWRLKSLEILLYLGKKKNRKPPLLDAYRAEQVEIIREIHRQLTVQMDRRFTIEDLAREHLMNPTTLKKVFKAVYGDSVAAHVKGHRMERAAELLRGSQINVSDAAKLVGYESQSKFTAAFKEHFQMLPTEYRRKYRE